jgi:hypothetical protein
MLLPNIYSRCISSAVSSLTNKQGNCEQAPETFLAAPARCPTLRGCTIRELFASVTAMDGGNATQERFSA